MSEQKTVTQQYITSKIDQILNENDHINKALEEINNIPDSKGPGDMGASSKADAIAQVVRSREETNQQLLELLTTMYQSLDDTDYIKQQSLVLLKYADDPVAFENAKEALELVKK